MNVELFYTIVASLVTASIITGLIEDLVDWFWNIRDRKLAREIAEDLEEHFERLNYLTARKGASKPR